jgi:LmbE family N-acetylglucosaminyl deacetylase
MARFQAALGLVAGVMLILSSAAHSLLGWKSVGAQLTAAGVGPDLLVNMQVAWQFGGMAMLVLGVIVIALFARRFSGRPVALFPAAAVGLAYLLFGGWALVVSRNPFFLIFIVPGLFLAGAVAFPARGGVTAGLVALALAVAAASEAAEPPKTRTLLAVFAHPDDEGVAGSLLARCAREGVRVHLAIATDGRFGVRDFAGIPAGDELAKARALEARCAAEKLGIEPPTLIGLPDGMANSSGSPADAIGTVARLVEEVRKQFTGLKPDAVVTWGPDGFTGHPDHRLVSAVVTQVFQEGEAGWPRNLYYVEFPRDRAAGAPAFPGIAMPLTADRYLTVRVPFEPRDAQRARAAFACHRSQFSPAEQDALFGLVSHFQPAVVSLRPFVPEESQDLFAAR